MMPPLKQAMGARIIPFFEKVTETFSYLVIDSPAQAAAIIDPVLDYDPAAGQIRTHSADAIANKPRDCASNGFWKPHTAYPGIKFVR
jgi:hypothetical protein